MSYEIKKATKDLLSKARGIKRVDFPLSTLKIGEYFEISIGKRNSVYNAIKHRKHYTDELKDKEYSIKRISENKFAVIRTV